MRLSSLVVTGILALGLTACSGTSNTYKADSVLPDNPNAVIETPVTTHDTTFDSSYDDSFDQTSLSDSSVIPGSQEDLIVNVGDRVYFGYDRSDLTPEALQQLNIQGQWLNQYPNLNIVIEGHADERGTREYNLALGDRRAAAVRDALVSMGVSPVRIRTISYGKERPEVVGSNAESWARNRRAVTTVQ